MTYKSPLDLQVPPPILVAKGSWRSLEPGAQPGSPDLDLRAWSSTWPKIAFTARRSMGAQSSTWEPGARIGNPELDLGPRSLTWAPGPRPGSPELDHGAHSSTCRGARTSIWEYCARPGARSESLWRRARASSSKHLISIFAAMCQAQSILHAPAAKTCFCITNAAAAMYPP